VLVRMILMRRRRVRVSACKDDSDEILVMRGIKV